MLAISIQEPTCSPSGSSRQARAVRDVELRQAAQPRGQRGQPPAPAQVEPPDPDRRRVGPGRQPGAAPEVQEVDVEPLRQRGQATCSPGAPASPTLSPAGSPASSVQSRRSSREFDPEVRRERPEPGPARDRPRSTGGPPAARPGPCSRRRRGAGPPAPRAGGPGRCSRTGRAAGPSGPAAARPGRPSSAVRAGPGRTDSPPRPRPARAGRPRSGEGAAVLLVQRDLLARSHGPLPGTRVVSRAP